MLEKTFNLEKMKEKKKSIGQYEEKGMEAYLKQELFNLINFLALSIDVIGQMTEPWGHQPGKC